MCARAGFVHLVGGGGARELCIKTAAVKEEEEDESTLSLVVNKQGHSCSLDRRKTPRRNAEWREFRGAREGEREYRVSRTRL